MRRVGLSIFLLLLATVSAGCAGLVSGSSGAGDTQSTLVVTNVQTATVTTASSQVTWITNVPANSSVDYGTTAAFGNTSPVDSGMVTSHQVTLTGLAAGTTYYYQVNSTDSNGHHGHGGNGFKTLGYSLSGTISPSTGGSGATVTLTGAASATATANSSGAYTFAGLASGTYTVTPSNAGYTFAPVNQNVTVGTANITGVNFTDNVAATGPTITTQPANQTVTAGQTATFTVVASGTAPLSYQWQKNGANIAGATTASYTTPVTTTAASGSTFDVVVSNTAGSVTSAAVTLTVTAAAVAPTITTQPTNQTVTAGQTATFTVVAAGTAPLSYQWLKNGVNIAGATSASYTTPVTTTADNGSTFRVVVTNTAGTVASSAATLTVNAAAVAPTITSQPIEPDGDGGTDGKLYGHRYGHRSARLPVEEERSEHHGRDGGELHNAGDNQHGQRINVPGGSDEHGGHGNKQRSNTDGECGRGSANDHHAAGKPGGDSGTDGYVHGSGCRDGAAELSVAKDWGEHHRSDSG